METFRHAGRQGDARAVLALGACPLLGQQHRHHCAEQIGHGRAAGRQPVEIAAGGKAFVADDAGAGHQRLETGVQRIGVKERQARVENIVLRDFQIARRDPAPPIELRVRAAHALGQARGSRRVEDGKRLAGLDVRCRQTLFRRGGRRLHRCGQRPGIRAVVQQPDADQGLGPTFQRRQGRTACGVRHNQRAAAVGQDVLQLHAPRRGVDRHHHGAQPAAAQHHRQEFNAVPGHQADAVATPDPGRRQARRPLRRQCGRIRISQAAARRLHPQPIAQAGALFPQQRRQCQRLHGDASPVVRLRPDGPAAFWI